MSLLDFLAELVEPPADCIVGYSAGDIPKEKCELRWEGTFRLRKG